MRPWWLGTVDLGLLARWLPHASSGCARPRSGMISIALCVVVVVFLIARFVIETILVTVDILAVMLVPLALRRTSGRRLRRVLDRGLYDAS